MKIFLSFLAICTAFILHAQQLDLQELATGFNAPLNIQHTNDDRLFIVERGGAIKIIDGNGNVMETDFLNLEDRVSQDGGERGLLGLAFHPDYANNGYFYVNYVNTDGNTQISRFSVSDSDPNNANPESELKMISVDQPRSNHNGGCLAFGPDGYLYITMGDGGGGGDTDNNAQNTTKLLGSLLRIDVNNGDLYSIPPDNPFIGNPDGRDEIWAYGLRNPWKFSFDLETGDLWIADVGQGKIEEINQVPAVNAGLNYGWRCYEGNAIFNDTNCPDSGTLTFPIVTYDHSNRRASITGGYVYRGTDFPSLQGKYIFADFVSNELAFIDPENEDDLEIDFSAPFDGTGISSFGIDNSGELYAAGLSNGTIYKVVDAEALSLKPEKDKSFALYPNPANDKLKLTIPSAVQKATISIFDLLGKEIMKHTMTSDKTQLDISPIKKGLYLVQVSDKTGILETQKLIVK